MFAMPTRLTSVLALALVASSLLSAVGCSHREPSPAEAKAQLVQEAADLLHAVETLERGPLTMAKYNAIQPGMELEQVSRILGGPGVELSTSTIEGKSFAVFAWRNAPESGTILCTFDGSQLDSKVQHGLQ
jgi:hypothetical protein